MGGTGTGTGTSTSTSTNTSAAPDPPTSTSTSTMHLSCASNVAHCLSAAMGITRVVDDISTSHIFRAFWFTQYYAFCAVVVLYIYRIQQGIVEPGKCGGYYAAGRRVQGILSRISGEDSLSKRYCLVLEELRREAEKVQPQGRGEGDGQGEAQAVQQVGEVVEGGGMGGEDGFAESYYGAMVPDHMPASESAVFGAGWVPSSNFMADLTSWGQFDSLVTAGVGMLDGGEFAGDAGLGFGMGM